MSKELDKLKTIDEIRTKHTKYHTTGIASGKIEMDEAYFFSLIHIAKSSLQRLEQIDNAKPSEALMFIQELLNISETEKHFINLANYDIRLDLIKTKQALIQAQEQEKVLSIIKEKKVDVDFLNHVFKYNQKLKEYNFFAAGKYRKLTQEEFDLLKEVLG